MAGSHFEQYLKRQSSDPLARKMFRTIWSERQCQMDWSGNQFEASQYACSIDYSSQHLWALVLNNHNTHILHIWLTDVCFTFQIENVCFTSLPLSFCLSVVILQPVCLPLLWLLLLFMYVFRLFLFLLVFFGFLLFCYGWIDVSYHVTMCGVQCAMPSFCCTTTTRIKYSVVRI